VLTTADGPAFYETASTTNNSYEPATVCVRHFWFEPAEQEPVLGLMMLIARGGQVADGAVAL
jgi:hypothetical protein